MGSGVSPSIQIAGEWADWASGYPADLIRVPGSWEEQGFGEKMKESFIGTWTKRREYVGQAWYVKEIEIPAEWEGNQVELVARCALDLRGDAGRAGDRFVRVAGATAPFRLDAPRPGGRSRSWRRGLTTR